MYTNLSNTARPTSTVNSFGEAYAQAAAAAGPNPGPAMKALLKQLAKENAAAVKAAAVAGARVTAEQSRIVGSDLRGIYLCLKGLKLVTKIVLGVVTLGLFTLLVVRKHS